MGNIGIFASTTNFAITIVALVMLILSCFYTEEGTNMRKAIGFFVIALAADITATVIDYNSISIYAFGGNILYYIFGELILLCFSMAMLAVAATQMLMKKVPSVNIILSVFVLGMLPVVYYTFVVPNGGMLGKLRYILPFIGMAYLCFSFASQIGRLYCSGYIVGTLATGLSCAILILRMSSEQWGKETNTFWYSTAFIYVAIAIAILLVKINALSYKVLRQDKELERNAQRLATIIKSSPFPIILARLTDDKIVMANNNAVKLFGILPQEVERYRLKDFFVDVENRKLLTERLEKEKEVQDFEILVKTPSGDTPFWLLTSVNVIDYNNDVVLYVAFQDITSRKNREVLLKNQAIRDPLTSLYNRRYFEEEVFNRIIEAKAEKSPYCVLMLDADHFKRVNDTYGHKVGDKVLIELASTCEKNLREHDIVARYGGEEFVVFLPKTSPSQAKVVAERLRESIASVIVYSDEGEEVRFTVSIGISTSEISDNVGMLIKTSDEALYKAKESGRNRVCIFTKEDLEGFHSQDDENIEKKELQNHHPIFDKEDNKEISLLDDISARKINENDVKIEDKKTSPAHPNVIGVDEDDL